jgi:hypothetical protein
MLPFSEKHRCRLPVKEEVSKASRKVEPMTSELGASPYYTIHCSHARLRLPAELSHKLRQLDIIRVVSVFGKGEKMAIAWMIKVSTNNFVLSR